MMITNKTIVITGATSGIGRALALQLAATKNQLILIARNVAELDLVKLECEKYGSPTTVFAFDLAIQLQIELLSAKICNQFSSIDILINNAGVSQRSLAMESDIAVDRYLFDINYFAPVYLTRKLFPLLEKSKTPQIVVISSMVGKFGFPLRSSYAASKQALHGFFESMQLELLHTGLKVTFVCPGRILTNVSRNALLSNGERHNVLDDGQKNGISAEVCAKKIVTAIEKKKYEIFITEKEHILWWIRVFWKSMFLKIASKYK